jgi:hypothetical protein
MDSLFDIVIALVIIYSILSPFLNKNKKKGKQVPQNKRQEFPGRIKTPLPPQPTRQTQPDDFDILREVENLFKETRMEPLPPVPPRQTSSENTRYRESHKPESLQDKWGEHVRTESEKSSVEGISPKYLYKAPAPAPVMKFDPLPAPHYAQATDANTYVLILREKFKDPDNLRDYFIVSEILGKPKAHRHRSVY